MASFRVSLGWSSKDLVVCSCTTDGGAGCVSHSAHLSDVSRMDGRSRMRFVFVHCRVVVPLRVVCVVSYSPLARGQVAVVGLM